jgi:uncharacterized protein YndB with AHSA1/START domain
MTADLKAAFRPLDPGGEIELVRRYRQPVAKVWAALATPARLAEWMGVDWLGDPELREGAAFDYRFRNSDLESRGKVLRFEPPHLLEHSWFDNLPPGAIVRWTLAADGEGSLLTLTHLFRAPDDAPRTAAGWTQLLDSLAASLGEAAESGEGMARWTERRDSYAAAFLPEATRDGRLIEEKGSPALRFERMLAKPPEQVWPALVEPEGIARWLQARAEVESRLGGRILIDFHAGASVVDGRITRWEPPRLLEYSWPEKQANGDSLVRFELFASAKGGTRLVLTHRLDAGGDPADFASGWHWHLDALDSAIEDEGRAFDAERWKLLRQVYRMTLTGK